jgi:NO-binding membrane sensor protein with MHYT domain
MEELFNWFDANGDRVVVGFSIWALGFIAGMAVAGGFA